MSIIQSAGKAVQGVVDTISAVKNGINRNQEKKKQLKNIIQDATNKKYQEQTGKKYSGPEDSFPFRDKPTMQWQKLYKESKKQYKN